MSLAILLVSLAPKHYISIYKILPKKLNTSFVSNIFLISDITKEVVKIAHNVGPEIWFQYECNVDLWWQESEKGHGQCNSKPVTSVFEINSYRAVLVPAGYLTVGDHIWYYWIRPKHLPSYYQYLACHNICIYVLSKRCNILLCHCVNAWHMTMEDLQSIYFKGILITWCLN